MLLDRLFKFDYVLSFVKLSNSFIVKLAHFIVEFPKLSHTLHQGLVFSFQAQQIDELRVELQQVIDSMEVIINTSFKNVPLALDDTVL